MSPESVDDPQCEVCRFKLSEHVPTSAGPRTCPREASGEGRYVIHRSGYTMPGSFLGDDDVEVAPVYRFEPTVKFENPYGHGWSPYS